MLEQVHTWIMQPFNQQMDLLHWVLFIIIILATIYLWNDVIRIAE